jgi:Spy/CpxP family protein refolding chaperone
MTHFRVLRQLAVTAGLLTLCIAPVAISAQSVSQTPQSSNAQGTMAGQDQTPPTHAKHGDELAKLNLSDDQKAQVAKIHEDMRTQMDAVKGDATLTADQKQAKMRQIHKASHQQVKQVLTPEQRRQMKADEMARKAARQQGGQAPPQQ